jgi:hypothetical protein
MIWVCLWVFGVLTITKYHKKDGDEKVVDKRLSE